MTNLSLATRIRALHSSVASAANCSGLNEFDKNAFEFLLKRLESLANECATGQMTPRDQRYGEIARVVVESDPAVIPPDLGGELIEVEKAYQQQ